MRPRRLVLQIIGVAALLVGLLWMGQGLGYINWPQQSFMISQRPWAIRGSALAVVGVLCLLVARRR